MTTLLNVLTVDPADQAALIELLQANTDTVITIAREPETFELPTLSVSDDARLTAYVNGCKCGDFDAVRAMLADEVELDLVARLHRRGKSEVGEYFARYAASAQWAYAAGIVEGRPAMLVSDRQQSLDAPAYFVTLALESDRVAGIRDFLFARDAMEGAALSARPWSSDARDPPPTRRTDHRSR